MVAANETFEGHVAEVRREAGPVVGDLERGLCPIAADVNLHGGGPGGGAVVHEVGENLPESVGIAPYHNWVTAHVDAEVQNSCQATCLVGSQVEQIDGLAADDERPGLFAG